MKMISDSPRYATWGTPVREPKEVYGYIPMTLCESEPGHILFIHPTRIDVYWDEKR